jgi:uncharacterized membrane protein
MNTNNISTYATWTSVILLLLQVICKYFNIPIGESDLTIIANAIVTLIITIWSSYNPNTIPWLGNAPEPIDPTEPVLNPEYECDDNDGC